MFSVLLIAFCGEIFSVGGHKSVNPLITKLTFSLTR